MLTNIRAKAHKLIIIELVVVITIAVLWWIFRDFKSAYSTLLGGLTCIIPSWYFIRKFFSKKKRTPQAIIKDFYLGEITKLFLSVVLLILIIKFIPVFLIPTLTGFIGAYFASGAGMVLLK